MNPESEPPKRVLFVITTSDVGGSESFLKLLAAGMDRRRFTPTVCSLCPAGRIGEQIAASGTPVMTLDMSPRARIGELIRGVTRLARMIAELEIDLVQSLLYRANMMSAVAGRLARRPVAVVAGQRSLTPMTGQQAALGVRWTRRLADHTVAVSQAVKAEMVLRESLDPGRVSVIGNAVDARRFRPSGASEARRSLGIDSTALLVGGVGRLTDAKGFEVLLEAAATVRARGVELAILLVGDGPSRGLLEDLARRLGIDDAVHFLGRRSDPERIYPAMDIFVLSSLREGSPNVLLEAMSCGIAAISTRVGGVPELIEDGVTGRLIPPGDAAALADALVQLAADSSQRHRLGAGGPGTSRGRAQDREDGRQARGGL